MLTQFTDDSAEPRPTLKNYIDVPGVYAVGRLDADSEGLLLLTDDGPLQHRLSDPRFDHPKTYWTQVEGVPAEDAIRQLRAGVVLPDYRTKTAEARLLTPDPGVPPRDPPIRFRKAIPTSWIELTITEGKNRQVRRMTAAIGYPTLRLIRTAVGDLRIDGLVPGEWRYLTAQERRALASPVAKKLPGR